MKSNGDVVHSNTKIKLSFKDRVKVLFGAMIYSDVQISCENEYVNILGSESKVIVRFNRKPKKGGLKYER